MMMNMMMMDPSMQTASGGTKRKWENQAFSELPAKSRLSQGIQRLKKGSVTKEDITYSVEEVEGQQGGKYVGSVVISVTGETYTAAQPRESKKDAENAAAEAALEALGPQLEPLMEEHKPK